MTLGELEQAALKLSRSEQTQLYNFVRSIVSDATGFRVGNSVKFTSRRGMEISGKVIKVNRKSVKVFATDENGANGVTWTVSPQLLEKV